MKSFKIKRMLAREILDSRGNPTIEVELETDLGIFIASVPSGASVGKYEAVELRDGGKRYNGKGVLKAIKNINEIIGPKLKGQDVTQQKKIDKLMVDLDGTENKFKLGANAILPVSIAVCRAGSAAKEIPLYKHITELTEDSPPLILPLPCFNIINGGAHAGSDLDIQEFIIIPQNKLFSKNLQTGKEIYYSLKAILRSKFGKNSTNIGDEGGFVPLISKTKEALDLILKTIKDCGNNEIKIGLDCAASQFYNQDEKYHLDDIFFSREELLSFYQDLVKKYPIIFLEDPFSEEDWEGWRLLKSKIKPVASFPVIPSELSKNQKSKIIIVADDLTVTHKERLQQAIKNDCANAIIIKPNQVGTITETLECIKIAKRAGWKAVVSHRSGETNDDFIADLSVGVGADFIKAGAPARGERVAKYNRLLKIEEELHLEK